MKICHILSYFPPSWGGSETHNYTLVKYLLSKGYDIEVIVIRSASDNKVVRNAPSIRDMKVNFETIVPVLWVHRLRSIIKRIEQRGKVDVFDVHHSAFMPVFLTLPNYPLLLSIHSYELSCPRIGGFGGGYPCDHPALFEKCWNCSGTMRYFHWRLLKNCAVKKAKYIMVKYNYLRNNLIANGIPDEKIIVIPYWIDVDHIYELSNKNYLQIKGINEGDKVFVFFGRLYKEKGALLLLDAFKYLAERKRNIKLLYIGDGPLKKELVIESLHSELKGKVIFLGAMSRDSLFRYLSVATAIVLPSPYDNYNWALIESMCTKKPIITTNVGGTSEILLHKYNALLADPDVQSLSACMVNVLEDKSLASRIAENAYRTVRERHSFSNLKLYEELIDKVAMK